MIPIKITSKMGLKDNSYYQVEGKVKSKIDNTIDKFYYPFKKIKKTDREVTFDQYGRMFINGKLFFPFGIFTGKIEESDLINFNKTHLNFILPYSQLKKDVMDMIYNTQHGKIKVMYSVKDMYTFNQTTCSDDKEEINFVKFLNKIEEFKNHPALFAWYVNDEIVSCFNRNIRNRTLTIHELDPNHPTYTVIGYVEHSNGLINATDSIGMDHYPVGIDDMRTVYDYNAGVYQEILKGKFMLPVIQIFDRAFYKWNRGDKAFKSCPPTIQEMRSMSRQGFAAGGRGMLFYSYFDLVRMDNVTSFEKRWKDVIEFTNQIWEYKDVILSIDPVDKIEYVNNYNVTFKQWKYKDVNYIVIVNLVTEDEIFEINIVKDRKIKKVFGLGKCKKSGSKIKFELKPLDVIMIRYNSNDYTLVIAISIIIPIIIILLIIGFCLGKRYLKRKNKIDDFINSTSKLMNDNE